MIDGLQVNISDSYLLYILQFLLHPLSYWIWLKLRISFKGAAYRDLVFVPTAKVSDSNQCPCIRLSHFQLLNQFSLHLRLHDSVKEDSWAILAKRGILHKQTLLGYNKNIIAIRNYRYLMQSLLGIYFLMYVIPENNEELTDPRLIEARHTCDYGR